MPLVSPLQVFPYVLEICMLVIYPVLLGVVYGSDGGYETVKRDYNFIVNSSLAGVSLVRAQCALQWLGVLAATGRLCWQAG